MNCKIGAYIDSKLNTIGISKVNDKVNKTINTNQLFP